MMQNKKFNYLKGQRTEDLAQNHLSALQWRIIARNVRIGQAEIDLIAQTPTGIIVFVEVKSNWDQFHGFPALRVNARKQQQIWRGAYFWLQNNRLTECEVRFDILAITWIKGEFELKHYENAFIGPRSYF